MDVVAPPTPREQARRSRGAHRRPVAAPPASVIVRRLLATILVVGLFGTGTYGSFRATSPNTGNRIESGTVAITANDSGSALFNLTGMRPGDSTSRCLIVTYTGTLQSEVRLYGTTSGTGLDPYLDLKVTRGTYSPSTPAYGSCTNFVADAADYLAQGAGVIYNGTLEGYADNYSSGTVDPLSGAKESWYTNESHVFRFEITVQDAPPAAQGLNATQTFTWEARNGDGTPYKTAVLATPNLLSYWRLGESSGSTATDSASGHNGTYGSGVTRGVAGVLEGDSDTAATFDGTTNSVVTVANESPFDFGAGQAVTFEAWIKPTALVSGSTEIIVAKGVAGGARQWLFDVSGAAGVGKLRFGYGSGLSDVYTSDVNVITQDRWTHVAVTYTMGTGSSIKLYVDGVPVTGTWTSGTGNAAVPTGNNLPRIGQEASSPTQAMFNGTIDEVAIYTRALSATEILAHANAR